MSDTVVDKTAPPAAAESEPTDVQPAVDPTPAPEPIAARAVVDGPVPSSPLFDKLTDVEKDAVKSLRAKLPEIFSKLNTEKPPTSVTIWGVELAPYSPPTAKEGIVLYKFLKARNMSLDAAETMLTDTLKWRQRMNFSAILDEKFPEELFGKLGVLAGKDKEGRPVTYNLYNETKGKAVEVFGDLDRFIRWRAQLMERSVLQLDFEHVGDMIQVHDYSGLGSGDRTPESKTAATEASAVFGAHYPELLYKKYFVGVPFYLSWVFWVFKAIVPSATFAKMQVVGTGAEAIGKELSQVIDLSELPIKYNGQSDSIV